MFVMINALNYAFHINNNRSLKKTSRLRAECDCANVSFHSSKRHLTNCQLLKQCFIYIEGYKCLKGAIKFGIRLLVLQI